MWKIKKSRVHGTGIFATEDIKANTKIIEYIGEKVTRSEGDRRSEIRIKKYLNSKTTGSVYIFELNSRYDIDGSFGYNKARYINHSCDPNCEVDIVRGRIWISSIKNIKKGQELNYDYGYEFDKDDFTDHKCRCGSKNCIGYIISSDDWSKFKRHISKQKKKSSTKR
tara:strand:- start:443 stop:943 length:501 start_codon:yes stop_codon:yes gene_type:complete